MTRQQILDLYFMEARARLIDVAAFLDRLDRAAGDGDFRSQAFAESVGELSSPEPDRAKRILLRLSDPTELPLEKATTKSAAGAFNPKS